MTATAATPPPPLAHRAGRARTEPWPAWPVFAPDEVDAAAAVLLGGNVNYWTGDEGRSFELEFAAHFGSPHAVACANGTIALELALHGLGVAPGEDVVVPARTFLATASAVALSGARPVFADVDRDSGNLTAATIEAVLTPRTTAVIVVHLGGWPADMHAIQALCAKRGIRVIEDCAQAHHAMIGGRIVGTFGDAGAFSFCQDKIMTTAGEGGMVITSDREVWSKMWSRKDHGKSFEAVHGREHPPGFRWLHESWGGNGRMTEVQAAVGRVQLRKLGRWVDGRARLALRLCGRLGEHRALRVPKPGLGIRHAYYRCYAYVRPEMLREGWTRDRVMAEISALGVPCRSGSCSEIYLEKAVPAAWRPQERLPVAAELGETSLCFTVHPTLEGEDMDDAADAVDHVLARATRG